MPNPLISPDLTDQFEYSNKQECNVYTHDCHNSPICKSYGSLFTGCLCGAKYGNRCTRGEKMLIRIANDSNPNAIYEPHKPDTEEISNYAQ